MCIGTSVPNSRGDANDTTLRTIQEFLELFLNRLEDEGTKKGSKAATCVYQYTRHIIFDSPQSLKMEALYSLKTLGNTIPATQHHMSEDLNR